MTYSPTSKGCASFDAFLGDKVVATIKVDLSTHVGATEGTTVAEPANRLALPKLITVPYRLYLVVNQVADKFCATIADYLGEPSSREKDLVDLVVVAVTQTMAAPDLSGAIVAECRLRRLDVPETFAVPETWGTSYAKLAKNTPAEPYNITAARALMGKFIDPVLSGEADGNWHAETQTWH
ncbi:MAG: hypothetical protein FWD29_09025 [Micrococcales bacterium]|nr:hypothetical protein [Micrococcales bacterium]